MNSEREIRDYLLGAVPSERREQIEQRILANDEFHLEVEIAEEELFDDYVRENLSASERRLFETNFLASPHRRQRLRFARAFRDKIDSTKVAPTTPVRVFRANLYRAALAASLIVAGLMGILTYQFSKRIQGERARNAVLTEELAHARQTAQVFPNSIFQAELMPKSSRGGAQPQLALPRGALAVRFRLAVPAAVVPAAVTGPFRIDLLNDAGQPIISQQQGSQIDRAGGQKPAVAMPSLTVTIETKYLSPGDYVLRVTPQHSSTLPEYTFQILRPPSN